MTTRHYDQFCPLASALDIVGERWTLLIVRELLWGPQRYSDLRRALSGIGTNLLAARLKALEGIGAIEREMLPPPAASTVYRLTEMGRGLAPVVASLARWGMQFLDEPVPEDIDPGRLLLGPGLLLDPRQGDGVDLTCNVLVDGRGYCVEIREGESRVAEGCSARCGTTLTTSLRVLMSLVLAQRSLAEAEAAGDLTIAGDRSPAEALIGAIGLPQTAPLRAG